MSVAAIHEIVGALLTQAETEEEMEAVSRALRNVSDEVAGMFAASFLERSPSWHALRGSSMRETEEPLPAVADAAVTKVIGSYIETKLKPLLR